MESEIDTNSRICPVPPGLKKGLTLHFRPRTIFIAASLTLILATAGLGYYWMMPPPVDDKRHNPYQLARIAIDGDANFSDTALLEGWPGDGSPENPFIIDGLDIDVSPDHDDCPCVSMGNCITIRNTRVDFNIRNCNVTRASYWEGGGPGAGI